MVEGQNRDCGARGSELSSQEQVTICSSQLNKHELAPRQTLCHMLGLLDKQNMVFCSLGGVLDT